MFEEKFYELRSDMGTFKRQLKILVAFQRLFIDSCQWYVKSAFVGSFQSICFQLVDFGAWQQNINCNKPYNLFIFQERSIDVLTNWDWRFEKSRSSILRTNFPNNKIRFIKIFELFFFEFECLSEPFHFRTEENLKKWYWR